MTGLYVIGVQRLKIFENMTIIRVTIKCFKSFMESMNEDCLDYDP